MRYQNIDLWVDQKTDKGYPLRAASETEGEARDFLSLDLGAADLEEARRRLGARHTDRAFLIAFGTRLYATLFRSAGDVVEQLFNRCCGRASSAADDGVRLRLRIEAPEIARLPWELLYWPSRQCFLGTSIQTPVVRYLEIAEPIRDLTTAAPVRVLVVIPANPELDTGTELANLQQAMAALEPQVELTVLDGAVTLDRISDTLVEQRFHVLHYIGHGDFRDDEALVQLNSGDGAIEYVNHEHFSGLFQNHPTMKLVVLNSCKGAELSPHSPFVGMAPQLLRKGIPAVVAMQYAVADDVAVLFAREFYRSLFRGWARGRIEVAISHARERVAAEFPDDRDIAAPVLFMRAREGVLFNLVTGGRLAGVPFSKKELQRSAAVARTHEQNIELLADLSAASEQPDLREALSSEKEELATLKRQVRLRHVTILASVCVALLVSVSSVVSLFDALTLDTKVESYSMALANLFGTRTFSEHVAILTLTEGPPGSGRPQHVRVLDRLSEAGARVVAFDLFFEVPSPHDDELRQAIERARERGMDVIVGTRDAVGKEPRLIEAFRGAVSGVGALCLGTRLGYAWIVPLTIQPGEGEGERIESLALRAVTAFRDASVKHVDLRHQQIIVESQKRRSSEAIRFSTVGSGEQAGSACPVISGKTTIAGTIIDPSPLGLLRDPVRRYRYDQVLDRPVAGDLDRLRGKIVLVGVETSRDSFAVGPRRERRFGFELHADALNALLTGATVRPLGLGMQLLISLGLALLGGGIRQWEAGSARRRWGVWAVALVLVAYLGGVMYAYGRHHVLLNTLYHATALVGAYVLVGHAHRWWSRWWFP
jgi:CHASE2 domain-containing sensor protein